MNLFLKRTLLITQASLLTVAAAALSATAQPGFSGVRIARTAGAPLAKALQGKPTVVEVYADWCPGCQGIKSTLSTLKSQYQGKVNFVVLDVTDHKSTGLSQARAQSLGLSNFFAANKSKTSTVAIINPATGQVLQSFQSNPNLTDYKAVLDSAIVQVR